MAEDRKVFPVEQVLELAAGKAGADVSHIASFILGRSMASPVDVKAAAPFAAAWLARLDQRFLKLDWSEEKNWGAFVSDAQRILGDNISLTPMAGPLQALANQALDSIDEANASLDRQTDAALALEKRVKELEPLEGRLKALQKKYDDLENKMKAMKADMGALQREKAQFQGKIAIDHEELLQNIKDAIKDGLKGLSIGAAMAQTVESAAAAEALNATSANAPEPEADFGFGGSSADSDGFGF